MFHLLKKDTPSIGSVLFRGNLPPRAEEFEFLRAHGVEISRQTPDPGAHWALSLKHRGWGDAILTCLKHQPPPPLQLIDYSTGLSAEEKAEAKAGRVSVSVRTPSLKKYALRDRKNLFRYLRAVMGDDGVVAADHTSARFWSRAGLDEELQHDADLDISALYCVHAVTRADPPTAEDSKVDWLHTHGLDNAGAFDFDILDPSEAAVSSIDDVVRAIAFAILEGTVTADAASFPLAHPHPAIRMVPAADFDRLASPQDRAFRDAREDHAANRSVICDPARGLLKRWSRSVRPSSFFREWDGGDLVIHFSRAATDLMAQRARHTLSLLRAFMIEFHDFDLPVLAKIGYPTDNGGADSQEHLWFAVHAIQDDAIEATLESAPFDIARLKPGDRSAHPVLHLTDWAMITPMGQINPRSLWPARTIRDNRSDVAEMIKMIKALDMA